MAKKFEPLLSLPERGDDKPDRQFVTSLARGLEVLRAFTPEDGPLGNQELALRSGLPKPTVSRITHTLTKLGYLDYIPRLARYTVAPMVLSLGHACVGAAAICRAAQLPMQELAETIDGSVALGARDRLQMVYLEVKRGSNAVAFSLEAGAHIPLYRSAIGAAFLSAISEKERPILMQAIERSVEDEWPTVKAQLHKAFDEINARGFCLFEGTYNHALTGVGVPVVSPNGTVYALSASGPIYLFPKKRMENEVGPRLIALRTALETSLTRGHSQY